MENLFQPSPPPPFREFPRNSFERIIRNQPPPPPPPPPPFREFPRNSFERIIRNQPPLPPPPPPGPPFGPNLSVRNFILRRRRYRRTLMYKEMLIWYSITLVMRQKLQTRKQKPREEWVITIMEKMEQVLRDDAITSWDKHCIYRVPHYLHGYDKKSYFPQTVSLGPYHHGKGHLLPMDHHKWRAACMVMKRTNKSIEMYIDAMKGLETRARACYEGFISLSSNEFIKMLVLDGCFVLEILRGAYKDGFLKLGYDRYDPVFAMRASMHSIQRDMVMLENQLPLFVLNRLLEIQLGSQNQTGLVAQLAVRFFNPLMPTDQLLTETDQLDLEYSLARDKAFDPFVMNSLGDKSGLHCLDALRRSLLRHTRTEWRLPRKSEYGGFSVVDKRRKQMIDYCVTELKDGGIKFRKRQTDRFWDIRFRNGYLEIPKLFVHDGTKSLFLNLIAFEQNHMESSKEITSYIVFMDNIIDSPEDVSHLRSCGIIEHWLESDSEVADLFNQIGQETIFDIKDSYLCTVSIAADCYYLHHNKYYRKWNAWKKTLKEQYFDSPWGYISFFAAFFLLFLTSSQSYFAAYSYYRPPS